MDIFNIIGYFGAFLYLLAYALLNLKKIDGNGVFYILMNMAGAFCVSFSCIKYMNGPSLFIQVCWIILSFVGLFKIYSSTNKNK